MKIGILTYHSVTNYGAVLQCYGVQKLIKKILPEADVEVINYQPRSATYYYLKRHLINNREYTYPAKLLAFSQFTKKHLNLSGRSITNRKKLSEMAEKYDVILVGSDEIWKVGKIRGWNPSYFLDFVDSKKTKLISYAASAGSTDSYDSYALEVQTLLGRFDFISVRDKYTKKTIESLVDTNVHEVLDPTLISDFDDISTKKKSYHKKYVLVYARMNRKNMRKLRTWADKNKFDIVSIGHKNHFDDKAYMSASPTLWLNLIQHAELMVTNYFHGTLLSIKSRTPLIVMFSKGKMTKVADIGEKLGFKDQIHTELSSDISSQCIDYSNIEESLTIHKVKSIDYLKAALLNE